MLSNATNQPKLTLELGYMCEVTNKQRMVGVNNRPFPSILMDCQTTDITHFADIFHYDVTNRALETL